MEGSGGKAGQVVALKVTVEGIEHVTATLGKMGQIVAEDMHKSFGQVGNMMQRVAKSEVPDAPLSNWGAWFSATGTRVNVTRGTTSRTGRNLSFDRSRATGKLPVFVKLRKTGPMQVEIGAYVGDQDAAASIYEKAGKKSGAKPGQGSTFKANLNRKRKTMYPRILSPAQKKADSWGVPYLQKSLEQSVAKIQRMMDRG